MASAIRQLEEKAICFICKKLMIKPVSIECGHNFCHMCIESVTENQQETSSPGCSQCPQCQATFQSDSLEPNKQLKNIILIIKKMKRERLCEEHGELLQLFCKDDGQFICLLCEQSQHRAHKTDLVEVVYPHYMDKFQDILTKLKKDQDFCESAKLLTRKQIIKLEENVEFQREKVQSSFGYLHNYLHEEEKCHLWILENKKEQDLNMVEDCEAHLEKQNLELKSHEFKISLELEKKCEGSAQNMLQGNIELQREKIQTEYRNLHNFLYEEEKSYQRKLQNEKEQVLSQLQGNETYLEKQSLELESRIQELEKKCQGSTKNLLQDVEETLKRNSGVKLEFPGMPSLQLQSLCNVSELYFHLKKMVKRCQVNMTLDPYTSYPQQIVSEDQKYMSQGAVQNKCLNFRRFIASPCVLGSKGFISERNYFGFCFVLFCCFIYILLYFLN